MACLVCFPCGVEFVKFQLHFWEEINTTGFLCQAEEGERGRENVFMICSSEVLIVLFGLSFRGRGKIGSFSNAFKYWCVLFSPLSFTSLLGQRVAEVSDHWWYSMLILPPLLKDSVAAPFLAAYYPDCVGMSPSCTSTNRSPGESNLVKLEHLKSVPNVTGKGHLQGSVA